MIDPPLRLLAAFQKAYPELKPAHLIPVPGRELWVAACPGDDGVFHLHAPDLDGRTRFSWRSAKFKRTVLERPLPSWARYPAGVVVQLCAAGLDVNGVKAVALGGEVPGLRYNYGLGLALAALLYTLHQRPYESETLIDIVEKVRREYIEA